MPASGSSCEVHDRVGQAARRAGRWRRAVAHRDHLALAARLEARRHQEEVGAGVDPARATSRSKRSTIATRPGRAVAIARASPSTRPGVAAPEGHDPGAAGRPARVPRRRRGRSPSADRAGRPPQGSGAGSAGSRPRASQRSARQAALPRRSSASYGAASAASRRRVPERLVEAVEDPREAGAAGAELALEAHPHLRPRTSRAYVGLTVLTMSARTIPSRSRSIPQASPGRAGPRRSPDRRPGRAGVQPW